MKIVHVLDLYDRPNNGVATATKRNVRLLRELGLEVRVLTTGEPDNDKIVADEFSLPFFQHLVDAQGFTFAKPDQSKYFEAFYGADIVHFHLPTPFCIEGEKIARQMGIATISSFHLQPQNITYSIGLGKNEKINDRLYSDFNKNFYSKFNYIHAPSRMIADQLAAHDYKAEVRVISNGVNDVFKPIPIERDDQFKDKYLVLMVGRLSGEKRQDLLIEAVKQSKYKDRIQLVFAGQGPERKNLEVLAMDLPNKPIFNFYTQEDLVKLINRADLYVHASDAEIEGISCLEAMACGLVPIISDSKLSATNSFALTEKSLFTAGDAASLAARIEYWMEHPEEKAVYSKKYAEKADGMRVGTTVQELVQLYRDVIEVHKQDGYPKADDTQQQNLLETQRERQEQAGARRPSRVRAFFSRQTKKIVSFIAYIILYILYGVKVQGRENLARLDNEGGISIMNHIHNMDSSMAAIALSPEEITFVSASANFRLPIIGRILKLLGFIPTPDTLASGKDFVQVIQHELKQNKIVHFFPEGFLLKNYEGLRDFRNGAFYFAVKEEKAILPMAIRQVKSRKGKQRWLIGKPRYYISIGEPLYPNLNLPKKIAVKDLKERSFKSVKSLLNDEIEVADRFIIFDLARIATFTAVVCRLLTLIH